MEKYNRPRSVKDPVVSQNPTKTSFWLYDAPDLDGKTLKVQVETLDDPDIDARAFANRYVRGLREEFGLPAWHPQGCLERAI
jgi:hypothetical protein